MHVTLAALFLCALGAAAVRGQGSGVNCTRSGVTSTRPSLCYASCPCQRCPTCPPGFTTTYRPSFPPSWHRHLNDSALFANWNNWEPYRILDLSGFGILSIAPHVFEQLPMAICVEEVKLEHNNLTSIQDGVFSGLRLRFVNLSHNAIEDMGPRAFDTQDRESCLQFVDASHNALVYMDTWPYYDASFSFLELFDLAHNSIGSFRSSQNFSFDVFVKRAECRSCRTAVFDLQWNNFSTADSLLGSTGLRVLRPDLNIPFDLGYFNLTVAHNDWFCDCHFFALRKSMDTNFLPTQYMATYVPLLPRCQSPHALQNQSLKDVAPDQLVCNISTAACPSQCLCQKIPARETILVNCSGLSSLPSALPEDELPLTLNLAGNRISALEPRSYLHRVKALDLRGNGLRTVSDSAVKTLQRSLKSLDLRDNDFSTLPSSLAALTASTVDLRSNPKLQCSCSLQWLADWSYWNLTCLHGDKQVNLASMATALDCANRLVVPIAVSVAVLVSVVVGVVVLYRVWLRKRLAKWSFRMCRQVYPALTPRRDQLDAGQGQGDDHPEFDRLNDVYVSLDDDDEEVRRWVIGTLLPALEGEAPAMTAYLRCRDARFGNDVADEVHDGQEASRRLLVVLSRHYSDPKKYCLYELDAWMGGARVRGATPVLILFHRAEECGVTSKTLQRLLQGELVFKRQDRHCLTDVKFALRR